jgi:hypothetical protein
MREIQAELEHAQKKHGPIHSMHEGFAVMLEELEELKAETFKQRPNRAIAHDELIQLAAMCIRTIIDVDLI